MSAVIHAPAAPAASPSPAARSGPAIRVDHVRKAYASHLAVRDISLTVPRGVVYGLLGPNGAGKTTTIRMMLNIVAPDEGRIELLGLPGTDPSLVDRIGYLPEERGLYRKMEVRRMLRFLGELKGCSGHDLERRIDHWLERLALRGNGKDWSRSRVDELSRGMQQKVQFIGALLHDPELVILDEPFSGLDPINAQVLVDSVVDLRRRGRTVVFSTHIMDNAERLCDAVCIIAGGEVVVDGTVAEVRQEGSTRLLAITFDGPPGDAVMEVLRNPALVKRMGDENRSMELDLAGCTTPSDVLGRLVSAGASIERFEVVKPSLHRIFLEKVGAMDSIGNPPTSRPINDTAGGAEARIHV